MSKYDTTSLLVLNSLHSWQQQFIRLNLASHISREEAGEKWCSRITVMNDENIINLSPRKGDL